MTKKKKNKTNKAKINAYKQIISKNVLDVSCSKQQNCN